MLKFLERLNPKGPQAERVIIFLCYSVFIIYAFCVFDTHFQGRAPEDKIYFSYTASVAEDADLNISNQLFKKGDSFEVSRTLNYPEFRNHGGIIFWLPFYSYGKLLFLLNNHGYHKEEVVKAAMAMSTVILGSLAVLLTFLLARSFFSLSLSFVSVIFIIFGTPFCYYMLF
ncbi:MAG: hypothetical protein NT033_03790, partial [Candidatus Omnitrophica bacterium]|nr:hypothetical protein [Candidatus Omnitrophota bacterium]